MWSEMYTPECMLCQTRQCTKCPIPYILASPPHLTGTALSLSVESQWLFLWPDLFCLSFCTWCCHHILKCYLICPVYSLWIVLDFRCWFFFFSPNLSLYTLLFLVFKFWARSQITPQPEWFPRLFQKLLFWCLSPHISVNKTELQCRWRRNGLFRKKPSMDGSWGMNA